MNGLGLYVRSSLLIGKTMLGQAPLHCFSKTKDCRDVIPENSVSKLNSHTGLGLPVGPSHPKTMSEMTKSPCKTENHGKNLNFAVKKDVWCSIVDRIFFNIKNQLGIARIPTRGVYICFISNISEIWLTQFLKINVTKKLISQELRHVTKM